MQMASCRLRRTHVTCWCPLPFLPRCRHMILHARRAAKLARGAKMICRVAVKLTSCTVAVACRQVVDLGGGTLDPALLHVSPNTTLTGEFQRVAMFTQIDALSGQTPSSLISPGCTSPKSQCPLATELALFCFQALTPTQSNSVVCAHCSGRCQRGRHRRWRAGNHVRQGCCGRPGAWRQRLYAAAHAALP